MLGGVAVVGLLLAGAAVVTNWLDTRAELDAPVDIQDYETIRRLAEQGDADAQFRLGTMYAAGRSVAQDASAAALWYQLAAEQGNPQAQLSLGVMYSEGRGVSQDDAEAARWYRQAAEKGNAASQYNLGTVYAEGRGVPQDYAEAVTWYRQAADQGFAYAQGRLGFAYYFGHGVPQDYVSAHMWFNIAASNGDEIAPEIRDRLANEMTREQIAEAQAQARNWSERYQGR